MIISELDSLIEQLPSVPMHFSLNKILCFAISGRNCVRGSECQVELSKTKTIV